MSYPIRSLHVFKTSNNNNLIASYFLQNILPRPDLTGLSLGKNLQIRIVNYAKTLYIVNHVCSIQGSELNAQKIISL